MSKTHDFVFLDSRGQVLATADCTGEEARATAQHLAQEYSGRIVTVARLVEQVKPLKCVYCGATLNTEFICPDCARIAPETILRTSK